MSACQVTGWRPEVWKDDDGWRCDQNVQCAKCSAVWSNSLAEGATWHEAIAASRGSRVAPSRDGSREEWKP